MFQRAVSRLLNINHNLSRFADAFEIIVLLNKLQKKYNSPTKMTPSERSDKKTLEMLESLMEKFDEMKRDIYDQKVMMRAQSIIKSSKNIASSNHEAIEPITFRKQKKRDSLGLSPEFREIVDKIELAQLGDSESANISNEDE